MRALLALDLFDDGHPALLAEAARWAAQAGATLDLGYVDGMSYVRPAILDRQLRTLLDSEMERLKATRESLLAERVRSLPEAVRGVGRYRYDHPPIDAFLKMAEGYDLLLVGTHGRDGLSRRFLGSFAEKLVRRAPLPTLVLRVPSVAQGSSPTTNS